MAYGQSVLTWTVLVAWIIFDVRFSTVLVNLFSLFMVGSVLVQIKLNAGKNWCCPLNENCAIQLMVTVYC